MNFDGDMRALITLETRVNGRFLAVLGRSVSNMTFTSILHHLDCDKVGNCSKDRKCEKLETFSR